MRDAFIAGGWGMYPTLSPVWRCSATCLRYATRPESRYVPLMITLGLFTLFAGTLGFITGVMNCCAASMARWPARGRTSCTSASRSPCTTSPWRSC